MDIFDTDNLCQCCKGTGSIVDINFDMLIRNVDCGLFDGLLKEDIASALRRYNYAKIKFFFSEIKKESGYDLNKRYSDMNFDERKIFLHGYWDKAFRYKNTDAKPWRGLIPLIMKYMRSSKSALKDVIKNSKHPVECPFCRGTLLGSDKKLVTDVSALPEIQQVRLKINELKNRKLASFTVAIKNAAPFYEHIVDDLNSIAQHNRVVLLDYKNINDTKGNECPYCNGSKFLIENSIFDGVDETKTPCRFCNQTGINKDGLEQTIENISVRTWLTGHLSDIADNIPVVIAGIKIMSRLKELNKLELIGLQNFIGGRSRVFGSNRFCA